MEAFTKRQLVKEPCHAGRSGTRMRHGPRQTRSRGSAIMHIWEHPMPIAIRSDVKSGDIGYITYLHGTLYAKEYQLDCTFEGYVAESLARFVLSFDAHKDRLWLAEMDGHIVGS